MTVYAWFCDPLGRPTHAIVTGQWKAVREGRGHRGHSVLGSSFGRFLGALTLFVETRPPVSGTVRPTLSDGMTHRPLEHPSRG